MSRVMRTHTGITEWNGDYWCDSCGRRVKGITIVNGMDFCAKCYQETFGETEKDRKIADLQSQLAEKDKDIKILKYFKLTIGTDKNNEIDVSKSIYIDQDKISFAIAELEKVKNIIKSKVESIDRRLERLKIKIVSESTSRQLDTYEEIVKEIDNQIASLKKGVE